MSSKVITFSTSAALFSKLCVFVKTVTSIKDLPKEDFPEIGFVGRSNVGKSSLLNALCGRTHLARVSHTPGRTQALNFFNLADVLYLVDLPGYGYAKTSHTKILAWGKLVEQYLKERVSLKRIFILVDSRHGLKPLDDWMMSFLDTHGAPYQIILTKIDKVSKAHLSNLIQLIEQTLKHYPAACPTVLSTSARKKEGIIELRDTVFSIVENSK